jgi:(1->4)-alpha-D-glucan 1-alpha-D-glucosylmutase
VSDRRRSSAVPDRRTPTSTYRLQLHAGFPFAAAEAVVPYLASLGVSHLYLSPILQAGPGSMHGYDVVDHGRVSDDLGGETALRSLAEVAHQHGLGIVVDVVPNHMSIPVPASLNRPFWDVLRRGRESAYARWFDIDWELCDGRLGLPVLGETFDEALADGALVIDEHNGEAVVSYRGGQIFPIGEGKLGGSVADVLGRQRYLLASWRERDRTLGYRRFFDVDTLIAVRVELPDVFEETHRVLLDLHADRVVDGFRVDHPDGLADPEEYLDRLHDATGGAWVVVEKILAVGEALPSSWQCAGTTGYDAIEAIQAALAPPTGKALHRLWRGRTSTGGTLASTERGAKLLVIQTLLQPEIRRLARRASDAARSRGRDADEVWLVHGFEALLTHIDAYRAYIRLDRPAPSESVRRLDDWRDRAIESFPEWADAVRLIRDLVGDSASDDPATRDLVVRFQQACGPVMAKGVEDTTFYRWNVLVSLNEVGGDPGVLDEPDPVSHFRGWATRQSSDHPHGMTALSTHDTKRDEDVRARITTAAEDIDEWERVVAAVVTDTEPYGGIPLDAAWLLMQTLVGAWPITEDRLLGYVEKAAREAKTITGWIDPLPEYEADLKELARTMLQPGPTHDAITRWAADLDEAAGAADLAAKLMQLTMPGVPDVYQGCEAVSRSLVDPDNRRPVDYALRRERLRMLDEGDAPRDLTDRKLLLTSRVLRLRRERPQLFDETAAYQRLDAGTPHAFAFMRGALLATVVTRWPRTLELRGGWADERLRLPSGRWRDALTGREHAGAGADVAYRALFGQLPVALLVQEAS